MFVYELSGCGFESRCCHLYLLRIKFVRTAQADLDRGAGGAGGAPLPLFFCNHLFFSVLIKVKVIIYNAPLTYVYPPNTVKTPNTQPFVVWQTVMLF